MDGPYTLVKKYREWRISNINLKRKECFYGKCRMEYPGYNGVKEIPTKIMLDFICRAKGGRPSPSDENSESAYVLKDKVLELIQAPAIIERCKAYLEYVTKLSFKLKLKRLI